MAKRHKPTTARRHPLVGRYAFVYICRPGTRASENMAGHYGGIIREVDVGPRKGLARVVLQRPSSLTASTLSGRCQGELLRVTDDRELATVEVMLPYRKRARLVDLVGGPS